MRLALGTPAKSPPIDQLIIRAKEAVRKGQMFWISCPPKQRRVPPIGPRHLTVHPGIHLSQDAINAALKANTASRRSWKRHQADRAAILKMSLAQQDPEYLQTHPWFAYLKPLPKAGQMGKATRRSVGI